MVRAENCGCLRNDDTSRAASSEWPPRSRKKSLASRSGWPGKSGRSASNRACSPTETGTSSSPLGSDAVASSRAFKALRSILPEVRRGTSATSSKRAGII
ncbi:hypothetical protein CNMCM8686_001786 [Aspergillus fumigatus]|nr:hypothetical protein CNMCM8686_001786 [Aspergillus fumigatus]